MRTSGNCSSNAASIASRRAHALEIRLEIAARHELVHGPLAEEHGRDVRRSRSRLDLLRELLGEDEPADAQPGRDRLRERRAVCDLAVRELEEGWERFRVQA